MKKQIEGKTDHDSLDLDHVTSDLLRAAVRDMGIDPDARRVLNAVAQTIANLDGRERIEAPHLAEAINYRMFVR